MTMEQMKPLATAEFNLLVSDAAAQQYFSDAFDLWAGEDCLYDDKNSAYKAIIRRYAQPINEEVGRINLATGTGATKRVTSTNGGTSHETGSTGKQSNDTVHTSRVENDGEFIQTARTYPDGYIEPPDGSYLSTQTVDNPYEQTDITDTTNMGNEDVKSEKETTNSGNAETEEIDELARAQLLTYSAQLAKLIESCVYRFVSRTVAGDFGIWRRRAWH